jgi:hypothetical protein
MPQSVGKYTHLAFLTIFPNTEGFTVVASKEHFESDALAQDDAVLTGLILAAKQVAKKINAAFDDVGRTGLFLEGFGWRTPPNFPIMGQRLNMNTVIPMVNSENILPDMRVYVVT